MSFQNRLWVSGMTAVCWLSLLVAVGCESSNTATCPALAQEGEADLSVPSTPLADYSTALAEGVQLPPGFYPLTGHYDLDNPEDHYDGWPRFIVSERDNMVMAYVPTRTVLMGGGRDLDEMPARHVKVNHFYMDLHEVTNTQFAHYFDAVVPMAQKSKVSASYKRYWVPGLNDYHPVRNVTWTDAFFYSLWTGKWLPTEAQWESAARGDDQRIYPWGNDEETDVTRYLCNARTGRENFDGYEYTAPVMNYSAGVSPYGIYNLSGNVWEWCSDYYDPGRYAYPSEEDPASGLIRGAKPFGDRNYPNPLAKDIREARVGPMIGGQRVIRGGSFTEPIEKCRVDVRAAAGQDVAQHNVGFRCVLRLPPQE